MRTLRLWPLLSCLVASGCLPCPRIEQQVTILSADQTLLPLLEACRSNPRGFPCIPTSDDDRPAPVACACMPLCRRVLEIVDQFQGPETIEDCHLYPLPDAGMEGAIVSIRYRPSSCP